MDEQGPGDLSPPFRAHLPKDAPYNALPYFKNPTLNPYGTSNAAGVPRNRDSFILISAGPDRIYGTLDDITTFGNVGN